MPAIVSVAPPACGPPYKKARGIFIDSRSPYEKARGICINLGLPYNETRGMFIKLAPPYKKAAKTRGDELATVPETLVYTILFLLMFSIALAHL